MSGHRSHQDDRQGPRAVKNRDNAGLSRNRRRNVVENDDYAAFTRRIVRAYGRRVGAIGDRLGISRQAARHRWNARD